MSHPDDIDRDAFYSADVDEDAEYELEPPDEEILSAEEHQARATIESLDYSIDVDELMREDERRLEYDVLDDWARNLRFRFRLKHLIGLTAVVAIFAAIARRGLGTALLLGGLFVVGGMLLYMAWKEREHQREMAERRRHLYTQRRAALAERQRTAGEAAEKLLVDVEPVSSHGPSLRERLTSIASPGEFVVAAVLAVGLLIALISCLTVSVTATLLGGLALVGLAAQAMGVEFPRVVAIGWWVMLVLYVLTSILLAVVRSA